MDIIYVGTMGIPAKYGGLETCVEKLSTKMVSKVDEVIVYSVFGKTNAKKKIKSFEGVKIHYVPQTGIPPIDRIIREFFPLLRHIFCKKKSIIHVYGPSMFSFLWRAFGHKVVHSLDGFEWKRNSYSSLIRSVVYLGYIMGIKFSHTITVDAKFVLNWIESLGIKATFLSYGSKDIEQKKDVQLPFLLKEKGYYVFVGRLVPEKGVHILIKAFNKSNTNKSLVLLGTDPLGEKYLQFLKKLSKNNDRIIFADKVFGYDFQNILMQSFAHIRPSLNNSEGINPVAVESLAYGTFILASDVDQNREAFEDCAIYFEPNSVKSLKNAINNLEDMNEEIYKIYQAKSILRAKNEFSWDFITNQFQKIYTRLANRNIDI